MEPGLKLGTVTTEPLGHSPNVRLAKIPLSITYIEGVGNCFCEVIFLIVVSYASYGSHLQESRLSKNGWVKNLALAPSGHALLGESVVSMPQHLGV